MNSTISRLFAATALLIVPLVPAQPNTAPVAATTAPASAASALRFVRELGDVREYALPNGLQVLLLRDTQRPAMSVNITYRVGSRHEGLGEYGAAHLLEHMLFKPSGEGTPPQYNDAKTSMQALGMRWNGTTSYDRTNYFANFVTDDGKLPERLDFMMGWLAAMMTQARFSPDDLKSEMTVVRNEFERAENEPGRILGERMRSAAYTTHGYGHPVIGTRADIENVPHARLMQFYKTHYRPDNATLIIAGDFNPDEVKVRIAKEFGQQTGSTFAKHLQHRACPRGRKASGFAPSWWLGQRGGGLPWASRAYPRSCGDVAFGYNAEPKSWAAGQSTHLATARRHGMGLLSWPT
jgi:predicted Zn-dependent peptidase